MASTVVVGADIRSIVSVFVVILVEFDKYQSCFNLILQIPRFVCLVLSPAVYILAAKGVTLSSLFRCKNYLVPPAEGAME